MVQKKPYHLVIKPTYKTVLDLKVLVQYRDLFYTLAWRDLKVRYKQTVLGFLWAIVQPTSMMLVTTIFVKSALKIDSGEIQYPIFSFSGFLLWTLFASGLSGLSSSLLNTSEMIKKIYFPRVIILVSSIFVNLFDFFIGFILFIFLLFFLQQEIDVLRAIVLWPFSLLITMISILGPGSLIASMNLKYRDFRYLVPFLIQFLLFTSPVMYSVNPIKYAWAKYCLAFNPMYSALALFRAPMTSVPLDWTLLSISCMAAILFLVMGIIYFMRTERDFADIA